MTTTSKGHIYKIICKVDEKFCYIGSTFNRLSKRMESHRGHYNKWINGTLKTKCSCFHYFQKYGIENFKIILIKSYDVIRTHNKDTRHLRAYETLWYNKTKCVNKNAPIRYLSKEQSKAYRENNKEHIAEKKKKWCENNKEQIAKKDKVYRENNKEHYVKKVKEYRENNKEKIKTRTSEKIKCDKCGILYGRANMARHQRSKKCMDVTKKN